MTGSEMAELASKLFAPKTQASRGRPTTYVSELVRRWRVDPSTISAWRRDEREIPLEFQADLKIVEALEDQTRLKQLKQIKDKQIVVIGEIAYLRDEDGRVIGAAIVADGELKYTQFVKSFVEDNIVFL